MKEKLKKVKPKHLIVPVGMVAALVFWNGYAVRDGCAGISERPCYDRSSGSGTSGEKRNVLRGEGGEKAFTGCETNASVPHQSGNETVKTLLCASENFSYCSEGNSNNFLRKFEGDCN